MSFLRLYISVSGRITCQHHHTTSSSLSKSCLTLEVNARLGVVSGKVLEHRPCVPVPCLGRSASNGNGCFAIRMLFPRRRIEKRNACSWLPPKERHILYHSHQAYASQPQQSGNSCFWKAKEPWSVQQHQLC